MKKIPTFMKGMVYEPSNAPTAEVPLEFHLEPEFM